MNKILRYGKVILCGGHHFTLLDSEPVGIPGRILVGLAPPACHLLGEGSQGRGWELLQHSERGKHTHQHTCKVNIRLNINSADAQHTKEMQKHKFEVFFFISRCVMLLQCFHQRSHPYLMFFRALSSSNHQLSDKHLQHKNRQVRRCNPMVFPPVWLPASPPVGYFLFLQMVCHVASGLFLYLVFFCCACPRRAVVANFSTASVCFLWHCTTS